MLKHLRCPNCHSSNNLIIFIDFKNKTDNIAICYKRKIKPHLVRKYHKIISNGCNHEFKVLLPAKEEKVTSNG